MRSLRDIDRLTIIYRKWVEAKLGADGEAQAKKWLLAVDEVWGASSDETIYLKQVLKLGALNAAIWERQNETRGLMARQSETPVLVEAGLLLFELTRLNDWRAQVVGEEKFGASGRVEG